MKVFGGMRGVELYIYSYISSKSKSVSSFPSSTSRERNQLVYSCDWQYHFQIMAADMMCMIGLTNETTLDAALTIEDAQVSEGFFFNNWLEDHIAAQDINGTALDNDDSEVVVYSSGDPRVAGSFHLKLDGTSMAKISWSSGEDEENKVWLEGVDERIKIDLGDWPAEHPIGRIKVKIYDIDDTVVM